MTHRTLLSFLMLSLPLTVFSQQAFEPLAAKIRTQPLELPAQTNIVVLTPTDAAFPRQTYTIQRTFATDGAITAEWKSATQQSSQTFRRDGTLVSSRLVDLRKDLTIESLSDPARTTMQTIIREKGKVKSDKKAALKPGIALRDELQLLNSQAWNAGIRDGLKFQSLSPDGGMVGDFQILYRQVSDPTTLSDKYTYPAEFKAALPVQSGYIVADMSLQGIGAFFFPHHFYVVYTQGPQGLEFVAYFGEDPKNPVFQFTPR